MIFDAKNFIDNIGHSVSVIIGYEDVEQCSMIDAVRIRKTANQNDEAEITIKQCGEIDVFALLGQDITILLDGSQYLFRGVIKKITLDNFENGFFKLLSVCELQTAFDFGFVETPYQQYKMQANYNRFVDGEELSDFEIFTKKAERSPVQMYIHTDINTGNQAIATAFISDKLEKVGYVADWFKIVHSLDECQYRLNAINIANIDGFKNFANIKIKVQYQTRAVRCSYFDYTPIHNVCDMAKCGFPYSPTVDAVYSAGQGAGVFKPLYIEPLPSERWITCDSVHTHWNPDNVSFEKIDDKTYERRWENNAKKYAYQATFYVYNKYVFTSIANFDVVIYDPASAEVSGLHEMDVELSISVNNDTEYEDFLISDKLNYEGFHSTDGRQNNQGLPIEPSWQSLDSLDTYKDGTEASTRAVWIAELVTNQAVAEMYRTRLCSADITAKYNPYVDLGSFIDIDNKHLKGRFGVASIDTIFNFSGIVKNNLTLNFVIGNDYSEINGYLPDEEKINAYPEKIYALKFQQAEYLTQNEPTIFTGTKRLSANEELETDGLNAYVYRKGDGDCSLNSEAFCVSPLPLPEQLETEREYQSNFATDGESVDYIMIGIESDAERLRACDDVER